MVHDRVWLEAGMRWHAVCDYGIGCCGILCIACLEQRLGRALRRRDFLNPSRSSDPWNTPLLAARMENRC